MVFEIFGGFQNLDASYLFLPSVEACSCEISKNQVKKLGQWAQGGYF